jgi:DNA mismatch repair protein MutS
MTKDKELKIVDEYLNYQKIYQEKYGKNTVIFMEVGHFFEMYAIENPETLIKITDILGIQLTRKNKSKSEISHSNPYMAGVQKFTVKKFINILLDNLYTIILVEQVTPKPNIIRKVTQIISPGTFLDDTETPKTNYIMSIVIEEVSNFKDPNKGLSFGWSMIDLSTGYNIIHESFDNEQSLEQLYRIIKSYYPKEFIILNKNYNISEDDIVDILEIKNFMVHFKEFNHTYNKASYQNEFLKKIFNNTGFLSPIEFLDLEKYPNALLSYIYLLQYCYEHNENIIRDLNRPIYWDEKKYCILENNAIEQLNIYSSNQNNLFNVIKNTSTPIGRRELRYRLLNPIVNPTILEQRYDKTELLLDKYSQLEDFLNDIYDLERLTRKMLLNLLEPYEFYNLHTSYLSINKLFDYLKNNNLEIFLPDSKTIQVFQDFQSDYQNKLNLNEVGKYSINNIATSIFKRDIYPDLDDIIKENNEIDLYFKKASVYFSNLIEKGSNFAKIDSTEVEGHFILVTVKRSQSIKTSNINPIYSNIKYSSNGARCKITWTELNNKSKIYKSNIEKLKILSKDKLQNLFISFYEKYSLILKTISKSIGEIDTFKSFAKTSIQNCYSRPKIIESENSFIRATQMRHPIIEKIQSCKYVANDIELDQTRGMIIYGLNGVGKSSIMKAIGLNIIMAQIGMFVPSKTFEYYPYDSIFTRIIGNDNLFKGHSSFTVEILELKNILKRSNNKSIVLGDELCHSTESTSGVAIVAGTVKLLSEKNSNFVFATHLHQLGTVPEIKNLNNIKSYHLKVSFKDDLIIYDRTLQEGSGNAIYGIEVAKYIIDNPTFINLATKIRKDLLNQNTEFLKSDTSKYNSNIFMDHCEICDAKAEDTHHIEEQNMANSKGLINYYHKNIKDNLVVLCKKCHDNVHNGNLNIKGWLFTSEGKKLDYEYQEQNKCKKKFDTEQIKYILELKDYKQNIAIQMLKENNISISKTTLRKIWNNQY